MSIKSQTFTNLIRKLRNYGLLIYKAKFKSYLFDCNAISSRDSMQYSKTPGTCTTASWLCARVRGKKFKRWDFRPLKVAQRWDAFVHIFIASMGLRILVSEPAEKISA